VLSAWTESKQWCGVEFGFGGYDGGAFLVAAHGGCFPGAGLTIPTSGWPGPGEGIALAVTDTPSLADTIGRDTNGRSVRLPDISSLYRLEFEDPAAAIRAIPGLRRTSGIRFAEVLSATQDEVAFPNDPYFDSWPPFTEDAQWFLQNDGLRWESLCGSALAWADIGVQWAWASGLGDSATVIGIVDLGILGGSGGGDQHEDLRVVPLSYEQRALISTYPDLDWCATVACAGSGRRSVAWRGRSDSCFWTSEPGPSGSAVGEEVRSWTR